MKTEYHDGLMICYDDNPERVIPIIHRRSDRIPTKPHLPSGCFPATEVATERVWARYGVVSSQSRIRLFKRSLRKRRIQR